MLHKRVAAELFHAYLVDSRGSQIDKSRITTFENQGSTDLRLFAADLDDPRRTNMESACSIPGDNTFIVGSLRLQAKFSSHALVADFIRSTRFIFCVGDKPMYIMEANALALANPLATQGFTLPGGVSQGVDDLNTDLAVEQELEHKIAVAPRQCLEVVMQTSKLVADRLRRIEAGVEKAFVEVRFTLRGDRLVPLEEPDYFPNKEGMVLAHIKPHKQIPEGEVYTILPIPGYSPEDIPPLIDCTMTNPYRGHGKPGEAIPFDRFAKVLTGRLSVLNNKNQPWSLDAIKQTLRECIEALPEYQDELGYFTIPPEDTTDDAAVMAYGVPFPENELTEAEQEFFKHEPLAPEGDLQPWNPMAYLQKKKPQA
jgi:hypothetical protein